MSILPKRNATIKLVIKEILKPFSLHNLSSAFFCSAAQGSLFAVNGDTSVWKILPNQRESSDPRAKLSVFFCQAKLPPDPPYHQLQL